jgi:hypothetical protein
MLRISSVGTLWTGLGRSTLETPSMRQITILCLFVVAASLVTRSSLSLGQDTEPLAKARAELASRDLGRLLNNAIPNLYEHLGDPRLTNLVKAIWELDRREYPELSWGMFSDPEFRIGFAQLWVRWIRETTNDKIQIGAVRSYVLPFLTDGNPQLRAGAVAFVGSLGSDSDIAMLKQIVLTDERLVASSAVFAIGSIPGGEAKRALDDLYNKVSDPWVRGRIEVVKGRTKQ